MYYPSPSNTDMKRATYTVEKCYFEFSFVVRENDVWVSSMSKLVKLVIALLGSMCDVGIGYFRGLKWNRQD